MSLELIRREELTAGQLTELEGAMAVFYQNPLPVYYQTAAEAWDRCSPKDATFCFDLVSRVTIGAFWINLRPRVLSGGEYGIDADPAHLERRRDLVWFWEQKGASILQTSADMPDISAEVLRYNCCVVACKPDPAKTETSSAAAASGASGR
jgi:hypothetical protein